MRIVIDTSVIIAVVVNEPSKKRLIDITRGSLLIAPNSVCWEIGNAFSAMFKRKCITLAETHDAIRIYHKIPIQFVDLDILEAIKLAYQLKIYAYDAYIIYCAMKHNCPLISLDKSLISLAKQNNIQVLE